MKTRFHHLKILMLLRRTLFEVVNLHNCVCVFLAELFEILIALELTKYVIHLCISAYSDRTIKILRELKNKKTIYSHARRE